MCVHVVSANSAAAYHLLIAQAKQIPQPRTVASYTRVKMRGLAHFTKPSPIGLLIREDSRLASPGPSNAELAGYVQVLKSKRRPKQVLVPNTCTVLSSWDDGHPLDLKLAGLLHHYGLSATFYVPVTNRGGRSKQGMSDEGVAKLSGSFEIGSHSMTHPWQLASLRPEQMEVEIRHSKSRLEEIIGKKIQSFCYPRGSWSPGVIDIVQKSGYTNSRAVEDFNLSRNEIARYGRFRIGCTIQARNREVFTKQAFLGDAFLVRHPWLGFKLGDFGNWSRLAKFLFDKAWSRGGVFHLWGHSWEIENNADWARLEDVLSYISSRDNTKFMTISQFAESL
jgi:peptidoglycan-N-acetylglucosamine deacetylase